MLHDGSVFPGFFPQSFPIEPYCIKPSATAHAGTKTTGTITKKSKVHSSASSTNVTGSIGRTLAAVLAKGVAGPAG